MKVMETETEMGVIMDEINRNIREAVPVIGRYCDIIGVRSFARFENKTDDYEEKFCNNLSIMQAFR